MTGRGKWKAPGIRRNPLEAARAVARAQASEEQRKLDLATAKRRWRDGELYPWRITAALDYRGLYGPEVDEACGVKEPCVDMWEDGHLYPTWEHLCALAELTQFPVIFFTIETEHLPFEATSMVFHTKPKDRPDPPVLEFLPEAYEAMRKTL